MYANGPPSALNSQSARLEMQLLRRYCEATAGSWRFLTLHVKILDKTMESHNFYAELHGTDGLKT